MKYRPTIVLSGICPKCRKNYTMWFSLTCPGCGYIGYPINDE